MKIIGDVLGHRSASSSLRSHCLSKRALVDACTIFPTKSALVADFAQTICAGSRRIDRKTSIQRLNAAE